MALLIYIVFNQLLVVGRDALANGDWSITIGLWPIVILFGWFALFELKWKFKKKAKSNVASASGVSS